MALTKSTKTDRIEVLEMGHLQIRTATIIDEDGIELSRTFQRHVLAPGDDTSGEGQRVQDVAAATWTADVLADWQAFLAAQEPAS